MVATTVGRVEAPPRRRRLRHIGALDGLRGAAVAGVLVFHGGHLRGGYLGVDLFFVLSGYLITLLLLGEWRQTERIGLATFWTRRARRLFPALALMLMMVAAYARFVAIPEELPGIRADSFATLLYFANWRAILAGHSYFQAALAPSPLEHTWSLAIEEQFYFVWPVVVVTLLRFRKRAETILWAALAVAAGSVALMIGLHLSGMVSSNSLYLGTHTRIAAIAMGASLAAWQVTHGYTKRANARAALEGIALASVAFLALMWSRTDLTTTVVYSGGLALCGLAVTAIIAAATHPNRMIVARAFDAAPLRWLGTISYGVYLYHWPIYLYLNRERTGYAGWSLFALQVVVTLFVATASFVLVERPIRRGALRGMTGKIAIPAAATATVIALLVATSGVSDIIQTANASAFASGGAGTPKVMLVGDSVLFELGIEGIRPLRRELHISVWNDALPGCTPMIAGGQLKERAVVSGSFRFDCSTIYADVVRQNRPDIVVLMYGTLYSFDVVIDGKLRDQCDPRYEAVLQRQLDHQVGQLSHLGARVVLVTGPAVTNRTVQERYGATDEPRRAACANDVLGKVAATNPRARLVDLDALICPNHGPCLETYGGQKVRADGTHFRHDVAKYIARWLVPRVLEAARAPR
ncbi:MAG: putative acyltransferase [Acidimicrobiales bacterium]|nr:putative acyltransferase [Acidimicrobiales bacterium]